MARDRKRLPPIHPRISRALLLITVFPACCFSSPEGPPDLPAKMAIDEKAKSLTLSAVVARQGTYDVLKGAIEYVLVSKGGKDYETLFVTGCTPDQIHGGLARLGLRPGQPAREETEPAGMPVRIIIEFQNEGKKVRRAADEFVLYKKTGKPLKPQPWTFTGSTGTLDPETGKKVLQCALTKSIVGLHYTDSSPLLQNPRPEARSENIYKSNLKELPPPGSPVSLIFQREMPKIPRDWKRTHVFLSGRVQGVGFRAFTQREARRLQLTGFVKNLSDGRVEAVIEGPEEKVRALLQKMKRGPRAARVKNMEPGDEPPLGIYKDFKIAF